MGALHALPGFSSLGSAHCGVNSCRACAAAGVLNRLHCGWAGCALKINLQRVEYAECVQIGVWLCAC